MTDGIELKQQPERANHIRELPWVADGVDKHEAIAATALVKCGLVAPATFDTLVSNPQTKEYVNNGTGQALGRLCDLEAMSPDLWSDFMRKRWVQDGLTEDEAKIIQDLYAMIFESAEHEESNRTWAGMINMPFLETIDRFDLRAVRALAQNNNGIGIGEHFAEIMSHPTFSDGASDEEAKALAMLHSVYGSNSDKAIARLLEPGGASLDAEERVIELPLAGEVKLTIFRRYRYRATPTMDLLERSVRTNEEFMVAPFPDHWVVLYFHTDDSGWLLRHAGSYGGTHMGLRREYDAEPDRRKDHTLSVLLHETGHYYWSSSQSWISEGGANFLEYIAGPERYDQDFVIGHYVPCDGVRTLAHLEELRPLPGDDYYKCAYQLGEGLFVELYQTLGKETFREGFRNLYLKRLQDSPSDDCEGGLPRHLPCGRSLQSRHA